MNQTPFKSKLDQRRDKLIDELKQVNAELESISNMTAGQKLAIELHEMFCTSNHTDGCAWCYEAHSKDVWSPGSEHNRWYSKAMKCLEVVPDYTVLKIATAIKS